MFETTEKPTSQSNPENIHALPLGEILVSENIISRDQLNEALDIQKKEKSYQLGKLLVDMHLIGPLDLQKAINELSKKIELSDLLLSKKVINESQLNEAKKKQEKEGKTLEEALQELNFLSKKRLVGILIEHSSKPKLGEWLVGEGLISNTNLKMALKFQREGRRIGHVLIDLGYITRKTLNEFISRYNKRESLLSALIREGYINQDKLNEARIDSNHSEESIKDQLLKKGLVDEIQILKAEAVRYEVPFQRFDMISYEAPERKMLTSLLSSVFVKKNNIIPAFINGNDITLATFDPKALEHIDYLKFIHTKINFLACFIPSEDFDRIYSLLYGKEIPSTSLKQSSVGEVLYERGSTEQLEQLENINKSKAVRLVDKIISKGIDFGASDIHIESDGWGTHVRYRIDGVLRNLEDLDLATEISDNIPAIISRLKVMSDMDLSERRLPQDGAFRMTHHDKETGELYPLDFRVSTIKGFGLTENMVIRILDPHSAKVSLEDLNYSGHDLLIIKRMLESPSGLFLLTGPTGCGKTTTSYACIQFLNKPSVKIVTSENPVEYVIKGVTQVNVHFRIGLTHAKVLRTFLRQDPDIIMLGEVRDEDTAEVMVKAAETGHLVISTLHTSDPILAILRLMDLGVSVESLASILLGVISQRLLKQNCPHCTKEYSPSANEWQQFFPEFPAGMHFYKGAGCEQCGYTGFKGRKPVYELLVLDTKIQSLLRTSTDMSKIREEALRGGMISMVEHAMSQSKYFSLEEMFKMLPYNLIEEFRTSPIIADRKSV